MKSLICAAVCFSAVHAFAVSSEDIRAGYVELNRACSQAGANNIGSSAARECSAAAHRIDANSNQLNREIFKTMNQRDQERQRIQQEELWRQQVRQRSGN